MTPHFPWVGEIAASFYEQTTGRHIDGVIAVDPFVIAKLLEYTGPIDLPAYEHQLAADNAVDYLLHDQYVTGVDDNTLRREVLADAASATFDAMMAGGLPDPIRLAGDLGPLVEDRRMLFWSSHRDEQELLGNLEIDGAFRRSTAPTGGRSPSPTASATRSTATSSVARTTPRRMKAARRRGRCASS